MRTLIAFGLAAALAGCAPSRAQLDQADYGPRPANVDRIAKTQFFDRYLKDPYTAHIRRLGGPVTGWVRNFGSVKYGWVTCYMVNARNSFGGYTGEQPYFLLIRNGSVAAFRTGSIAQQSCATIPG